MDIAELEALVGSGAEMPDGLNSAEQTYLNGLSYLYARFRAGDITKEEGANYKRKMRAAYDRAAFDLSLWEANAKRMAELAGPAAEFRKNPNLEDAWRMHDIIFRVKPSGTGAK